MDCPCSKDDLEQGDLLWPTQELRNVLREVHPRFCLDKYLAFAVTTQSCDLVRRPLPAASYLNIAVVRPLASILCKLLGAVAKPVAPGSGLFKAGSKVEAKRFLGRLFNQNEQKLGLFYLHPDADLGLGEHAVALLRVSVALKATHYQTIQHARFGRLRPEFQAKLGWLVGNLYGRPATPDWSEKPEGQKQVENLIEQFLGGSDEAGPCWVDDALVAAAAGKVSVQDKSPAALLKEYEQYRAPDNLTLSLERVACKLRAVLRAPADPGSAASIVIPEGLDVDGIVQKVVNRLRNDAQYPKLIRKS